MRVVFLWERVEGPRTPEGGLTGKGGVVRVGMGWERWERGGLEKERVVVGFGGDGSVGVVGVREREGGGGSGKSGGNCGRG